MALDLATLKGLCVSEESPVMAQQVNVLALPKYDRQAASSRYRFFNYFPYLEERGVVVTPVPLLTNSYVERRLSGANIDQIDVLRSFMHRVVTIAGSYRFDALWIEGELFPRFPATVERLLGVLKKPYVLDLDDAIFHTYDQHPSIFVRRFLNHKIDVGMRNASVVTAGNAYLAERAIKAGARHVTLVPTTVDDQAYVRPLRSAENKLTFGWIGSLTTANYLQSIRPELEELCRTLPARLRLIGLDRHNFDCPDVLPRPWTEETEIDELALCDIGLAPLCDGPWERGKCGLKAIQYMAAGIPVLAAKVGALTDIVAHGETGFHYQVGAEFTSYARRLAADPELRMQMARAGKSRVATRYSLHRWADAIADILRKVARHDVTC